MSEYTQNIASQDQKAANSPASVNKRRHEPRRISLTRPDWLPESVWPFETFGLEIDDSIVAVTDVGSGPALLFVHCGLWSFVWRDVISRLASDFRCIAFDAPGTGRSATLPGDLITLDRAARAVNGIVEGLALDDFALVVHDLGGHVGIAGAALTPERVRGIAGINTFAWKPSGALFRGMLAMMASAPIRELDVLTGFLPRITRTSFGVGRHLDAASRRAFFDGIGDSGRRAFHYYMRDARHCDPLYDQVTSALSGPFAALPVVTIFGERNDPLGFQPRWKAMFPDVRQVVVAKGNHFPMCDDPDLTAATIRSWHRQLMKTSRT
jgi:pimeloyl-ACP methyl ester carboxylesterase